MTEQRSPQTIRHNFVVNVSDGSFFGLAMGFASFVTILPLFVSQMTDSALLIGLIPAIHSMGWQLPQLLTVNRVGSLTRYRGMVLAMTIHERLPFLALALIAWLLPSMSNTLALVLTFLLLIWQGLGGGFTATAWQSMIAKIMPESRRGFFFGVQSAAANLFAAGGALAAGWVMTRYESPNDFALLFLIASIAMTISWFFLMLTREQPHTPINEVAVQVGLRKRLGAILRHDVNFRWFMITRMLSQVAVVGTSFFTIYAVRTFGMSDATAGVLTGLLMVTQTVASPVLGWAGDRWGHKVMLELGMVAALFSALGAWLAPSLAWFYPIFILAGIANLTTWTTSLAITPDFAPAHERPAYIGLSNTLIAPATMLAPVLGGWIADTAGFGATFLLGAGSAIVTGLLVRFMVRDPRRQPPITLPLVAATAGD